MVDISCPVCGDDVGKRGLKSHLGTHKKEELKDALCEVLKSTENVNQTLCQERETQDATKIAREAETSQMKLAQNSRKRINKINRKAKEALKE